MWWNYCVLRYENGEMRPAETVPDMEQGETEENDGGSEFNSNI
jgi:hypothetical protein